MSNMKIRGRLLLILTLAWMAAVLLRFLFYHELSNLWILVYLIDALYLVAAVTLAVFHILRKKASAAVPVLGIAIIACVFFFTSFGWKMGAVFRFARMHSSYETRVVEILEIPKERRNELASDVRVDFGPPKRIAFSWGGVLDNWSGVVYDPSGEVLRASEFKKDRSNWDAPELQSVKNLFDGDLRYSFRLRGDWYFCIFT